MAPMTPAERKIVDDAILGTGLVARVRDLENVLYATVVACRSAELQLLDAQRKGFHEENELMVAIRHAAIHGAEALLGWRDADGNKVRRPEGTDDTR